MATWSFGFSLLTNAREIKKMNKNEHQKLNGVSNQKEYVTSSGEGVVGGWLGISFPDVRAIRGKNTWDGLKPFSDWGYLSLFWSSLASDEIDTVSWDAGAGEALPCAWGAVAPWATGGAAWGSVVAAANAAIWLIVEFSFLEALRSCVGAVLIDLNVGALFIVSEKIGFRNII